MNLCRLCGEEKSPIDFSVELNDKTNSNWSYRDLIEHHTRVSLKSSKLLPQSICEECRAQIERFAAFSVIVETVENGFDVDEFQGDSEIKECFVQVEELLLTSIDESQEDINDLEKPQKKRRSQKSSQFEELEQRQTAEDVFFNQNVPAVNINLSFKLGEGDTLDNGEIYEQAINSTYLPRWSDLIKSCGLCDEIITNPIQLSIHHGAAHKLRGVEISCFFCSNKFKRIFGFLNHVIKHSEYLTHCCVLCDKLFINLNSLNSHIKENHPEMLTKVYQCLACGQFSETITLLRRHNESVHLKSAELSTKKRRKSSVDDSCELSGRSKRSKSGKSPVKLEDFSSDKDFEDSESEYHGEDSDSDEKPLKSLMKRETKRCERSKRYGNSRKSTHLSVFGREIDTFEKLFAEELEGTSKFQATLHLNISANHRLSDGEISEEFASRISEVRWRDILRCGICKLPFTNIEELLEHAESKHFTRAKVFHCQSCEGEFTAISESILVNHLVDRHYFEHLKFCCMVCSKMFYDLQSLHSHYKTHSGNFQLLVCLICGWYAKSLTDLKEHKTFHVTMEKSENQVLCEKVFDKFNSGQEVSAINQCVGEYERNLDGTVTDECERRFILDWSFGNYDCQKCSIHHTNPFELFVHRRLKHAKEFDKKLYSCSLCIDKKDYSNLFTFVNHATAKHLDNGKFTCVVCSRTHWNFLALANHYKNVHPAFPCVFCCHCGKIFMNVTIASSHFKALNLLRTPEERKLLKEGKLQEDSSHICHVCARQFKNRGTLLNHVKTHETLQPSDLLQCHICSKFYKNKYKLAQHMVLHEDARSWKCKECGQAFNYKKLLQRHVQAVHENERNFPCTFCEKRFNSKYDLTVHVRLHTGEFPYECPIDDCDAKYPAWSNLFKHCQSRHKLDIRSEGYKKLRATQKSQKTAERYESE